MIAPFKIGIKYIKAEMKCFAIRLIQLRFKYIKVYNFFNILGKTNYPFNIFGSCWGESL